MVEKPLFTVSSKEEMRRLNQAGEPVTYFRIWATTRKGTYFHIDVPEGDLNKAQEALTARATQLDAI